MKTIDRHTITVPEDPEGGWILAIDKPPGWSSSDVVRKVKFRLNKRGHRKIKVGHAGTLDPLATGVLLVCVGREATRRVDELQAERKEYVADIIFGATTPSCDMEHPVDATWPHDHITLQAIERALGELCGERLQEPPVYSAKMIDGRRAYEYAREGSLVKMRQAMITIYAMRIEEYDHPRVKVRIECGKGTYIRSIARELGEKLDSGAYLGALCRTASGGFRIENCLNVEQALALL